MNTVLFIGFGEIGSALAGLMAGRALVLSWDRDSARVTGGIGSMREGVEQADVVFACVPSWTVRGVMKEAVSALGKGVVVVSLAKGLEPDTLKTMDRVLEETLPKGTLSGVLGGPLLAEELTSGQFGVGVLGAKNKKVFETVQPLFEGTPLVLEYQKDSTAVAYASVLKNIYAVALGIAEGLGWGWNGRGWLCARGLQEMSRVIKALCGGAEVIHGTAGAGDFFATALSPDSFNHQTGRQIALMGKCEAPSEGCRAVGNLLKVLNGRGTDLPILYALDHIINQDADPKTVFENLLGVRA